jgi:hypothetical protein
MAGRPRHRGEVVFIRVQWGGRDDAVAVQQSLEVAPGSDPDGRLVARSDNHPAKRVPSSTRSDKEGAFSLFARCLELRSLARRTAVTDIGVRARARAAERTTSVAGRRLCVSGIGLAGDRNHGFRAGRSGRCGMRPDRSTRSLGQDPVTAGAAVGRHPQHRARERA